MGLVQSVVLDNKLSAFHVRLPSALLSHVVDGVGAQFP
jgi:hypothetical protein